MSVLTPVRTTLLTLVLLASVLAVGAASQPAAPAARPAAAKAPASARLPAGFSWRTVVRQLPRPTDMVFAPDGRLFITLKSGVLRVRRTNGSMATLLNFSRKVNATGERGLLGIAVDPGFTTNHHLFLVYTHRATGNLPISNRLVRITVRNGRLSRAANACCSGGTPCAPPTTKAARSRSAPTESCTPRTARTPGRSRPSRCAPCSARSCG
jgi:glucose/arabinose dehydrogenase